MSFPSIVDQTRESFQRSPRPDGAVRRFIWHHQAGTNDDNTIRMMVEETRQVSATFTVDNKPPASDPGRSWARITGVVPVEFSPWTSSSRAADGLAYTAEVANSTGSPDWGIAEATVEACALIAAWAYRAGVPLKRATREDPTGHLGHNEVLGMFGQGYTTACPLHLPIDRILARGRELVGSTTAAGGWTELPRQLLPWEAYEMETDMLFLIMIQDDDRRYGGGKHYALTGPGYWVHVRTEAAANVLAKRFGEAANVTYAEWDQFQAAGTAAA